MEQNIVRIDMARPCLKRQAKVLVSLTSYNDKSFDYYNFLIFVYRRVIDKIIKDNYKNIVIHIDSGNSDRKEFELALRKFSIAFARHSYVKTGNKIKVYLH